MVVEQTAGSFTRRWRLLRGSPSQGGGGRGGWCRTRRHHVDRLAATLTCAGRNRSVFMRRRLPQTVRAGDRPETVVRRLTRGSVPAKAVADASCDRGAGRSSSRSARRPRAVVMVLGGHLGPYEPGEFAGNRGGDDGAAVFARREALEPSTQSDLASPGTGDH